jgi:hypothetical protein
MPSRHVVERPLHRGDWVTSAVFLGGVLAAGSVFARPLRAGGNRNPPRFHDRRSPKPFGHLPVAPV